MLLLKNPSQTSMENFISTFEAESMFYRRYRNVHWTISTNEFCLHQSDKMALPILFEFINFFKQYLNIVHEEINNLTTWPKKWCLQNLLLNIV